MLPQKYLKLQQLHFQAHIALEKAYNLKGELELLEKLLLDNDINWSLIHNDIDKINDIVSDLKLLFDEISKKIANELSVTDIVVEKRPR